MNQVCACLFCNYVFQFVTQPLHQFSPARSAPRLELRIVGALADGNIIEDGSNSNGYWLRLADGTQYCWKKEPLNVAITTASGNIYVSSIITWTFPAVFYGDAKGVSCIADSAWVSYTHISSSAKNEVRLCNSIPVQALRILSWFAIGRWKE